MKTLFARLGFVLGIALGLSLGTASAQVYNWTPTTTGAYAWDNVANWGGSGFPNATTDTANLTAVLTGNQTISSSQNITINSLSLNNGSFANTSTYLVQFGGGNSLTFAENGATQPTLTVPITNGGSHTIDSPITITASQLTVNQGSTGTVVLTLAQPISGSGKLVFTGTGRVLLSGVNTYSGGTTISSTNLRLGAANALPSGGALTMDGGNLLLQGFTQSVGTLTYSQSTSLRFGTGNHSITFASLAANPTTNGWSIQNYGPDTHVYFNSNANFTTPFLNSVQFIDSSGSFYPTGAFLKDLGNGQYELIPAPEPATVLGIAALGLVGVGYLRRRLRPTTA